MQIPAPAGLIEIHCQRKFEAGLACRSSRFHPSRSEDALEESPRRSRRGPGNLSALIQCVTRTNFHVVLKTLFFRSSSMNLTR